MDMKSTLSAQYAAEALGVTTKTLQRWDRDKVFVPAGRSPTNRRLYAEDQILSFLSRKESREPKNVVAYCRVSSVGQKSDLKNQRSCVEEYCRTHGIEGVEYVEEIGGGLNMRRKLFTKLMIEVEQLRVKKIIIAHKDRLARFGFEWFADFMERHKCELVILNQEKTSPEQEMVQDLMTIVHCFSSRLYGLRRYKKDIKKACNESV